MHGRRFATLLAEIQEAICTGAIDRIVNKRKTLLEILQRRKTEDSEHLLIMVVASLLHLVQLEKVEAAASLAPYVRYSAASGKVEVRHNELERLCVEAPAFLAGLICAEIGNLLHRTWQAEEGEDVARRGLALLERSPLDGGANLHPLFVDLLRCLAIAWWARLGWQTGYAPEALQRLERLRIHLAKLRRSDPGNARGVYLVTGIVLDLTADLLALRGDHMKALDHIHEARVLVEDGRCEDRVRTAHILYTNGKILATQVAPEEYYLPILLFDSSQRIFPRQHPLKIRAINRKARCYLRGGDVAKAKSALEEAMVALKKMQLSKDERRYCDAEVQLTGLFLLERDSLAIDRVGQQCRAASKSLIDATEGLPSRLRAEAYLHHGIAEMKHGDKEVAERSLVEAWELVERSGGPATTRISVLLARSELMAGRSLDEATQCFAEASRLLADVRSTFLHSWRNRLEAQIRGDITIRIDPNGLYSSAQKAASTALRAYLQYQELRAEGKQTAAAAFCGVSRQRFGQLRRRYGLTKHAKG